MNLLNIVVFAITFKFVYFILNALVAKAIDIGQNDILIEDKRDENLMWATSGVALTLEDVGLHNLRGGTWCRKTKNKRNRIKALRKIAFAQQAPTSSDESCANLSLLEPSWIKDGESNGEDEGETYETTLTCNNCRAEHQLEPSQISDLTSGRLDPKNFCCDLFGRSCISDVSSDSDYGIFDERSSEDDNNFATEGVSKDFQQFIPKYIKTWIQEAKECDWDESIFVQWLRDFDETEDNLHINMRITEDSWLTTSVIDKTAEYIEAEESISIEDLLKPCEGDEEDDNFNEENAKFSESEEVAGKEEGILSHPDASDGVETISFETIGREETAEEKLSIISFDSETAKCLRRF